MKKLINYFLAIIILLTTGCGAALSSFDSSIIMHTEYEGKNSFNLKDIKGATVAFLPFRGTLGGYVANKTVRTRLCQKLTQDMPEVNYLHATQLIPRIASKGPQMISQYNNIMEKFLVRGRLSRKDLAVFDSIGIDYVACISLNGIDQSNKFLFLLSMQIWEVDSGKMVWDLTQEGQIYVAYNDNGPEIKSEVMAEVTDYMLARISG